MTAVDFSAEALSRARRLGADIDWRQADVRELEIAEGAYDLVVLADLHLQPEAMREMLARAAGGVAAGGLVVIGHHVDNHEHGCGGPSNPAVLHDPEWIGRALAGFEVERSMVSRTRRHRSTAARARPSTHWSWRESRPT